jgi:hypothetical protein
MIRVALVVFLVCCKSTMPTDDSQPFVIPTWSSAPTDDQIVQAIAGTGGDRAERERIARELLLPLARIHGGDPAAVTSWLEYRKGDLESLRARRPHDTFAALAVHAAITAVRLKAMPLARAKLHAQLFPTEPMPEAWEDAAAIDIATIEKEARTLDQRLATLSRDYAERFPLVFADKPPLRGPDASTARELSVARNALHVALTGDHAVTSSLLFDELVKRRITTLPLPGEFPE